MTRLRTGHEYLLKKKKKQNSQCVSNAIEFYQPNIFYLNAASTTLKRKNNFTSSPDVAETHGKCPELTSTMGYNHLEKKGTVSNDQKVDATLIIN